MHFLCDLCQRVERNLPELQCGARETPAPQPEDGRRSRFGFGRHLIAAVARP
jgi:hypothetical protein